MTDKQLPSGWSWRRLGDLCEKPEYGWTTKAAESGRIRFLRTTDITKGVIDWASVPYCHEEPSVLGRFQLAAGDIVISRSGSVGVSKLIQSCPSSVFASYLVRFRPKPEINGKYLALFLQSPAYWTQIAAKAAGIALQNINAQKMAAIAVPVAPADEQDRIVAEIEKQFTRLDAGVDALRRLGMHLRRYRAAVLKAACQGDLVPKEAVIARTEGRPFEDAPALLAAVAVARRAAATMPSARPRSYREPASPKAEELPPLPPGWAWATLDALTTKVADGVHKKPNYVAAGVPFITVKNLTAGPGLDFTDVKYITEADHSEYIKRTNPEAGDLLITKDGTLGVVRVVPPGKRFSIFVSVALLKPVVREMTPYLALALQAPQVQAQMVPKGTGLVHLHLEDLREDCVPVPPLQEQHRIVAAVEARLSEADATERAVAAAVSRARRLRESILDRAFRGSLLEPMPGRGDASSSAA